MEAVRSRLAAHLRGRVGRQVFEHLEHRLHLVRRAHRARELPVADVVAELDVQDLKDTGEWL